MGDSLLVSFFREKFGRSPSVLVSTPGRVNIIGEHIDYNGYSVLPIAIRQSIHFAAASNQSQRLSIHNHNEHEYPPFSCAVTEIKEISKPPKWYDYVLCGVCGVLEKTGMQMAGLDMAVSGEVPAGQGLSSSSALVCGAALTALRTVSAGPDLMSFKDLAQLCADSEKYVGTQGGGMDQAATLLSSKGCAQLISFNPLRCEPIVLPSGACFVVASSLQSINKAATSHFNCRVVECRIAGRILAKKSKVAPAKSLADLQTKLGKSLQEMLDLVEESFHEESYTLEEVLQILEISEDFLKTEVLSENTRHLKEFELKRRVRHVFSEAMRVKQFKRLSEECAQGKRDALTTLKDLGALMFLSHSSGRYDYECSHEGLDTLVELSKEGGAYGARLTGAGWGGCIVALVPEEKVSNFIAHLKEKFYRALSVSEVAAEEAVFYSPPSDGARVLSYTQD